MIFNSCFLTIIPFSRPNMYFFDYKVKTPSRTMRGREYHVTEIILIAANPSKKWAELGRRLEEGFNQAPFSFGISAEMGLPSETKIEPDRRLLVSRELLLLVYSLVEVF